MTIRQTALIATWTSIAALAGTALAQSPSSASNAVLGRVHVHSRPGFVHPGYFGYHASTIAEGYLRGRAAVIESMGRYNYDTSLALINREEARRMFMMNRQQAVETRFAMREVNLQYRKSRRTPINQEKVVRYNQSRVPKRMTANQLDPISGNINWPVALAGADFEQQRDQLEDLFLARNADNGGLDAEMRGQVQETVRSMREDMKQRIHDMNPSQYLAVRKFLTSLAYEARFAPEPVEQLASN